MPYSDTSRSSLSRRGLLLVACALALGATETFAQVSGYPNKPVKILVGTAPGGPSDFLGRLFAQKLSEGSPQPFVVDNKPGAGGTLAAETAAHAAPDGYTLLVSAPTVMIVAPHLYSRLNFDTVKDFAPIALLDAGPQVLVVNSAMPVKNAADLLAYIKSKPGQVAYASGGQGTAAHLSGEQLARRAGVKMVHVPYKGDGQAINDVLAGQVPMMFTTLTVAGPHIKSGRLRAIGVTSRQRAAVEPDIATLHESGLKDFEGVGWWIGIYAPAGTPRAVIDQLNAQWQKARQLPDVRSKLEQLAVTTTFTKPEDFANFQKTETTRVTKIIRDADVKPE